MTITQSDIRLQGLGEIRQAGRRIAEARYLLRLPHGHGARLSGELLLASGPALPFGPTLSLWLDDGRSVDFRIQPTSLAWGTYRIVGAGPLR
jgi:hypothetical protein